MPDRGNSPFTVEEERVCPDCGSDHLVRDDIHGELICAACGFVVTERAIDHGPEWVAHSIEEADRLARTGPPRKVLTGGLGLTTVIPFPIRDTRGGRIPERDRQTFIRLRRLQRVASYGGRGERSSVEAVSALDRVASHLGLPRTVRDEAGFIFKKAVQSGYARGRSIPSIAAAAVYAACRIDGIPRTLDEMEDASGVLRKRIAMQYRGLVRSGVLRAVPLPRPRDYVDRFCSELGLSRRVEAEALRILKETEAIIARRSLSPVGTAATAIYVAAQRCGEPRRQNDVAKVSGVSEVTLRTRLRSLGVAGEALPRSNLRGP
ncbi:MAG: transcription initiation factor IIB [Thermoplasmata archaeon]